MGLEDVPSPDSAPAPARPYLGVHFDCCSVYTRIYRNPAGTAYEGKCPRCARELQVPIGSGGTDARFFRAE